MTPPGIGDRFFDYDGPAVREGAGEMGFLTDRPDGDWRAIAERAETRRYRAGATLVKVGERDQSLYMLTSGMVGVVLPGQDTPFKEIEAPSVLGEVAFIDGGPRSVTLVALSDCELLRLSMESFEVLAARRPELGRAILLDLAKILAIRLRIATDLMNKG